MADIEVVHAEVKDGRLNALKIRFKGNLERQVDRDTVLQWLYEGHSLIPVSGHGHHVHRAPCLERVEVDGEVYVRCDTRAEAADAIVFPGHHH